LIGNAYWVDAGSELPNGDSILLMYDVNAAKIYCNADYDYPLDRIPAERAIELFGIDRLVVQQLEKR
jgi:hypothetical protein